MNARALSLTWVVLLLLGGFLPAHAQPQKWMQVLPLCEAASAIDAGCFVSLDFDAQAAAAHLGDKSLAYWLDGTTLRIAARSLDGNSPNLCCTFQDQMWPLQGEPEGLWGLQYDLPFIDESILDISLLIDGRQTEKSIYRGFKAPVADRVESPKGHVERVEIDSVNLGQRRGITIYTPPLAPPMDGYPVIYMADNAVAAFAPVVEKLIVDGVIRPVLLVGIDNGGEARGREYLPGSRSDPQAYERHEAFVLEEVMPLAEKKFHAAHMPTARMTYGFSNGGAWALSFGIKHHDLFGQVSAFAIAGSPDVPYDFASSKGQTLYLGAGAYDYFNAQTAVFCKRARQAGLACHYLTIYAGHDFAMWEQGLIGALKGAFPANIKLK